MNRKRIAITCPILGALLVISTPAFGANWTFNSAGGVPTFGWTNGRHLTGIQNSPAFGSPSVDSLGFHFRNEFNDMSFRAEVGGTTVVNAGVQVHVDVANSSPSGASPISLITIRERGTWGGNQSDLVVQASFLLLEYDFFDDLQIGLPAPTFFPDGTWVTQYTLPIPDASDFSAFGDFPDATGEFDLTLINIIQANGSTPGTFVQKTSVDIIFPEPGTLVMLSIIGVVALRRGRRQGA